MKYDVVVIGGGPAGMMAAGRAGELGARVLLLEKKSQPGIKLLMTGNGRCNITSKIAEPRILVKKFGQNGKFLFSALSEFGVKETMEFFESRGVKLKIEDNNRVLPKIGRAQDVLDVLLKYLKDASVKIKIDAEVREIIKKGKKIEKIILADGEEIIADNFIIATGGKSYPQSGSNGDGYKWLKKLGHEIIEPKPALTPIILKEKFIKKLEGLSLSGVKVSLFKISEELNDKKPINSEVGDIIFTANGLSGPAVLNLSRVVVMALPEKLKLSLDFFPDLSNIELEKKIRTEFENNKNKTLVGYLEKIVPRRLAEVIIDLAKIDSQKAVHSVTKEERKKIIELLKEFSLLVQEVAGFDKAMITVGGVKLSEVDQKTLKSKLIDNLYLAGEVLDLAGPTGGFNLQVCWSTGYLAGQSAVGD